MPRAVEVAVKFTRSLLPKVVKFDVSLLLPGVPQARSVSNLFAGSRRIFVLVKTRPCLAVVVACIDG